MINKEFDTIVLSDFQALIENGTNESRTIEYKQELKVKNDADKKEFLFDVSSFANAAGGDLIFGIKADKGIPVEVIGLSLASSDEILLQLESLIRDAIAPRLNNIQMKTFKTEHGTHLLLIRIPKGWNVPHQVIFKGTDKFYSRGTNGKYKMDISELRIAFTQTTSNAERIQKYIDSKRTDIVSDVMPVAFDKTAKICLHLVPFLSLASDTKYDLSSLSLELSNLRSINGGHTTPRFNLQGWLSSSMSPGPGRNNYVHLFHNGIIEAVNGELLYPYESQLRLIVAKGINYEVAVVDAVENYLQFYKQLKADLPIELFISFIGIKDYYISCEVRRNAFGETIKFPQQILYQPGIVFNDYDQNVPNTLKFAFDQIWNGCGFTGSANYDQAGNWKPITR